jgi:hypothetical protein
MTANIVAVVSCIAAVVSCIATVVSCIATVASYMVVTMSHFVAVHTLRASDARRFAGVVSEVVPVARVWSRPPRDLEAAPTYAAQAPGLLPRWCSEFERSPRDVERFPFL